MEIIKKIWPYILTFFAGVVAVFAISTREEDKGKPFDSLIDKTKDDLEKLNEKEKKIKEGVEEKTPEEEIEYWKNRKL